MNKQEAMGVIESISYYEKVNVNPLEDLVNKIYDDLKPVMPKFVAEWIEWCKTNNVTLLGAISPIDELGSAICNDKRVESLAASRWAQRNQDAFARAWLDGYEVEKEKLYTVEIPDPHGMYKIRYLFRNSVGNIRIGGTDYRDIFSTTETHLTESEIKQDFEWAFQFAKEVEEVTDERY